MSKNLDKKHACRIGVDDCRCLCRRFADGGSDYLGLLLIDSLSRRRSIVAWHQSQADVRAGNGAAIQRHDGYVNDVQRFGTVIKISADPQDVYDKVVEAFSVQHSEVA